MWHRVYFFGFFLLLAVWCQAKEDGDAQAPEEMVVDDEKVSYAKGSVCGYCEYCKFCKLCEEDCPCETSASKPNCKLCKYCKYCYICNTICDTVCKPGGIIDTVSATIVNALPSHDPQEVDQDIDSVKDWIDKSRDEL